jgi:membrane protein implicated in regulation of membrane protease activity
MLGMRTVGLFISTSASTATLGLAIGSFYGLPIWKLGFTLVAAASLMLTLIWWRVVNSDWVRDAARDYAERLLDSLDVLLPIEAQQAQAGDSQM